MAAEPVDLAGAPLSLVITPMRRRHLRGVLRIEHQVYPRPWSLGLYMGELALLTTRVYLVARNGSAVVGYCGLMIVDTDGHITTIAVDPARQRRQVATRLLLWLVRAAADRGVERLTLEVRMSNTAAQDLYRGFGFEAAGARKAYYADNREDALVMWAHDIDTPAYRDRLAAIEAGVRGSTAVEGVS